MTDTMSFAIARFAYGVWSGLEGGQSLWPYPRRSAQTTVKFCEHRRNVAPHQMRLRKSVQQENGRPRTGATDEDSCLIRPNIGGLEIFELHWPSPSERRQANK